MQNQINSNTNGCNPLQTNKKEKKGETQQKKKNWGEKWETEKETTYSSRSFLVFKLVFMLVTSFSLYLKSFFCGLPINSLAH